MAQFYMKQNVKYTFVCLIMALTPSDPLFATTELASNLDSIASSSYTDKYNVEYYL